MRGCASSSAAADFTGLYRVFLLEREGADGRDNSDDDAEDQICLLEANLVVEEPEPRVRPPMRSTPRGLLRDRRCALPHFSPRNDGETQ